MVEIVVRQAQGWGDSPQEEEIDIDRYLIKKKGTP